jgi:hypothetical protein
MDCNDNNANGIFKGDSDDKTDDDAECIADCSLKALEVKSITKLIYLGLEDI